MERVNYTGYADDLIVGLDSNQTVTSSWSSIVPTSDRGARTAIFVVYFLTCVVGTLGNGLVIYVILRHPEIRTKSVANCYILNLAIADFCLMLTLFFFCYATLTGHWAFGWFSCKLAYSIRECNKYVSIFTLVALAVDRYLASFYSAARFRTSFVGKLVCAGVWACFAVTTTPYWIYAGVTPIQGGRDSCRILSPSSAGAKKMATLMKAKCLVELVPGFLVPFLLIVAAYAALAVRLHRVLSAGVKTAVKRPGRVMTRMTLVITVTFLVTQLPYNVVAIMNVSKMEALRAENADRSTGKGIIASGANSTTVSRIDHAVVQRYISLNAVAMILVFVGSCCNPIIYGFLNRNYRKYTTVYSVNIISELL